MRSAKNDMRVYLQPAFLICVALLAIAGSGMSAAIKIFDIHLKKEPLALRKPLHLLEEDGLGVYRIKSKQVIEKETMKSLGTEEYIQWILEDLQVSPQSPVRYCSLFITYYDLPDRVPHIPDECFVGGGFKKLTSENVVFEIDINGVKQKIPGTCSVFTNTNDTSFRLNSKVPVFYLFSVNGTYAGNRDQVRIALNKNIFGKYSYFSKIEITFPGSPTKEEAINASRKLLGTVLPVLEAEYWPRIQEVEDE